MISCRNRLMMSDMLELASGLTLTSRLGCQIKVTEELDGLTLSLPQRFVS